MGSMDRHEAPSDRLLLLGLSAIPVAILLWSLVTPGYGYFIDEFYYLACARRLAFGYVDHPPLAPFILAGVRAVAGESLFAVRLLPALATGGTVFLAGLIVQRLGGGRLALVLAGLGTGLMPVIMAMGGIYSMNAYEPLLWTATMLVVLRILQGGSPRWWLLVGLLVGLGFENKHTVIGYAAALAVAVVLTDARRLLREPWLYAGAALAIAIALPNVVWQQVNGWPSLEFYRNAHLEKNVYSPPLQSVLMMVLAGNPVSLLIWGTGLVALLRGRMSPGARLLGLTATLIIAQYIFSGSSRPDRPAGTFPMLYASGAVVIAGWATTRVRQVASALLAGATAIGSLAVIPGFVPLMPPAVAARYTSALGLIHQAERGKTSPVPQMLADRTGWESFVTDVKRVYDSLPPEDQKRTVIYAPSYGHAGALELWGPSLGLPRVVSGQNTYWHWSLDVKEVEVLLAVDADGDELKQVFREVRHAGLVECDYCMSWRSHMDIHVARGSIVPFAQVWPSVRHYE